MLSALCQITDQDQDPPCSHTRIHTVATQQDAVHGQLNLEKHGVSQEEEEEEGGVFEKLFLIKIN